MSNTNKELNAAMAHIPGAKGMYDPQFEKDSCGVGFIADLKGNKSREIVDKALSMLMNLEHRGAVGADPETGDGAGILMQMPHDFMKVAATEAKINLPNAGEYGVAFIFMPQDKAVRKQVENIFEKIVVDEDLEFLGWRKVPVEEKGMAPKEIWCNESQERYVLAIAEQDLPRFAAICERERCPFAVLGHATAEQHLEVADSLLGNKPVDMDLSVLLGKPPKMTRSIERKSVVQKTFDHSGIKLRDAATRVLQLPSVASKNFLITIGDRSVTGMVAQNTGYIRICSTLMVKK